MSLILDALNRSRHDADPVPGLDTQHQLESFTATRRPYWLWIALAVAVLVIGALVVDRLRAPQSPEEGIAAPVAQLSRNLDSAVASVTTELKARAAAVEQAQHASAPVANAAPAVAEENSVQAELLDTAQAVQADNVSLPMDAFTAPDGTQVSSSELAQVGEPSTVQPAPTVRDDEVAQLYQDRNVPEEPIQPRTSARQQAKPVQRDEESVDLNQILQLAQEEMKNASLDEHPVPFLADLSQQTKDTIPTVYYQKHDYSSDPSVSSVILNGNSAKVGGSPVPGLKVEEILPDSVVLSYQGTQFRLRALNSWVNL